MREIIFRGKTIQWNEWVYGDLINYRDNDKRILEQNLGAWNILECGHEVIPESVGQWTGLKDQNEIKIFEGDILKYEYNSHFNNFGIVKYSKDGFSVFMTKVNLEKCYHNTDNVNSEYLHYLNKDIDVIGNIFDNNDLLEDGK